MVLLSECACIVVISPPLSLHLLRQLRSFPLLVRTKAHQIMRRASDCLHLEFGRDGGGRGWRCRSRLPLDGCLSSLEEIPSLLLWRSIARCRRWRWVWSRNISFCDSRLRAPLPRHHNRCMCPPPKLEAPLLFAALIAPCPHHWFAGSSEVVVLNHFSAPSNDHWLQPPTQVLIRRLLGFASPPAPRPCCSPPRPSRSRTCAPTPVSATAGS